MRRLPVLFVLVALVMVPSIASATALLRITPPGVASNNQPITSPVPIPGSGFRLTYHSQGNNPAMVNPVLLILGIPNAAVAPPVTLGTTSGFTTVGIQLGGPSVYGGNWNATTGAGPVFNSSSPNTAEATLGLNAPTGSQNYTNWSCSVAGTCPNSAPGYSWNLFVYSLSFNPNITPGSWAQFTTNLPVGSFVIGYGCDTSGQVTSGPPKNGGGQPTCLQNSVNGTPFTFAGLVTTQVPESSSLVIASAAFFGLAAMFRRRRQASK